jgi:hypothetical protein
MRVRSSVGRAILAEVYAAAGDTTRAIAAYPRVIALSFLNATAYRALRRLGAALE